MKFMVSNSLFSLLKYKFKLIKKTNSEYYISNNIVNIIPDFNIYFRSEFSPWLLFAELCLKLTPNFY